MGNFEAPDPPPQKRNLPYKGVPGSKKSILPRSLATATLVVFTQEGHLVWSRYAPPGVIVTAFYEPSYSAGMAHSAPRFLGSISPNHPSESNSAAPRPTPTSGNE